MFLPAMRTIAADPACQGAPLAVYVWLSCHLLSVQDYAPLKVAGVAQAMAMSPGTVRRALRLLTERHYLDVREGADHTCEARLCVNTWHPPPSRRSRQAR